MRLARAARNLLALALVPFTLAYVYRCSVRLANGRGGDFETFVASARAALAGLDPFAIHPGTVSVVVDGVRYYGPNLNPPISVLAFLPVAGLDTTLTYRVWVALSALMFLAAAYLLLRAYPAMRSPLRIAWMAMLPGIWDTLWIGQLYAPVVLLSIAAWVSLERGRHLVAGVCLGLLVAIKPNFVIWPALLLLSGYWRTVGAAAVVAGLVSALPLAAFGPTIYLQWLAGSRLTPYQLPGNASLMGLATQAGAAWIGLPISVLVVGTAALLVWHYRPAPHALSTIALIATLLASPVTWTGYLLVLLPAFAAPRRWTVPMVVASVCLAIPTYLVLTTAPNWALLLLGATVAYEIANRKATPADVKGASPILKSSIT